MEFELQPRQFSIIGNEDKRVIESGEFSIFVGGSQPDVKNANTIYGKVNLTGENVYLKN